MTNPEISNFKNFYNSYHRRCFLYAKSYAHDDAAAEDIASEALIKLWEISRKQDMDNLKFMLYAIVKHKILDYLKHQAVKQNVLDMLTDNGRRELEIRISTLEATDPERVFADDIQGIIHSTLSKLPEQTRRVFEMSRFQQYSKKEIADCLHISVKGVDYHLAKALKNLRENLKDYYPLALFLFF